MEASYQYCIFSLQFDLWCYYSVFIICFVSWQECDPQNLLDNIRVVAADAEHSSDSLAEDFMEGKLPLEDFLKQYSDKRTVSASVLWKNKMIVEVWAVVTIIWLF